ncbi:MAG: CmpA/NrtA family ABC transporter substrate-binding protein [Pseudomonadota bacterium]
MKLRAGFIPLLDCAVLAVAARMGFAEREGLELELVREASWATIRDKLTISHIDCAHILAPMVVASQLQAGNPKAPLVAPFALSMNGNAISLSNELWDEMGASNATGAADRAANLKKVVEARKTTGADRLTFGMVYPFSSHNYQLRYWLASAGIDPDEDVNLVVIPPPFIVDYLREGFIDGFCVGAPWNSIGARERVCRTIVTAAELWPMAPEKVLGVRETFAEQESEALAALMRALKAAARFTDAPNNRAEVAKLLSAHDLVGVDAPLLEAILSGQIVGHVGDPLPTYVVFNRSAATFPWRSHALWFYSQMVRWGQVTHTPDAMEQAQRAYRPDIYRDVFTGSDVTLPAANAKVEGALSAGVPVGSTTGHLVLEPDGFFDGRIFDPSDLDGYIGGFDIRRDPRSVFSA